MGAIIELTSSTLDVLLCHQLYASWCILRSPGKRRAGGRQRRTMDVLKVSAFSDDIADPAPCPLDGHQEMARAL